MQMNPLILTILFFLGEVFGASYCVSSGRPGDERGQSGRRKSHRLLLQTRKENSTEFRAEFAPAERLAKGGTSNTQT
ncbi:hypothetical protein R3P38DRAFT_2819651 [Favolaschia claudopus]|uniref:Secreted protein n=1 Tax=Favolaschia claudopus TaxID=2862362 RepID=A0AAW0EG41_9AGAR